MSETKKHTSICELSDGIHSCMKQEAVLLVTPETEALQSHLSFTFSFKMHALSKTQAFSFNTFLMWRLQAGGHKGCCLKAAVTTHQPGRGQMMHLRCLHMHSYWKQLYILMLRAIKTTEAGIISDRKFYFSIFRTQSSCSCCLGGTKQHASSTLLLSHKTASCSKCFPLLQTNSPSVPC